ASIRVRLRRDTVDRTPLPPPRRGWHAVLRHHRLRDPRRPGRDRPRPRHSRPGPRLHRQAGRLPEGAAPVRYVYPFEHKHRKPPMSMKDLLGGKGANLAEMTSVLELPVPPGFTITTDACRAYMEGGWPDGLSEEIERHLKRLEKAMV